MHGENFDVKYLPGSEGVVADVLEAFPVAWAHVDEGFEHRITRRQEIKLFQDMEHLKATVYLSMPDEILGGWQEPGESIKFMASYTEGENWRQAFAHEYGHVATFEMGPHATNMAWWAVEGVAELAAEEFRSGYRSWLDGQIGRWARAGQLAAWADLSDYRTTAAGLKWQAYVQGHHMVAYLSERWGRQKRNQWLRAMANGSSLDGATRQVFGLSFAELDGQWRAAVEASSFTPPETAPPESGK
jgi:hypothetical protein